MAACDLCLFLTVPWVGLQSVLVVFPGHSHYFFLVLCELYAFIPDMSQVNCEIKAFCFDSGGPCRQQEQLRCADGFQIRIKAILGWFHQTDCTDPCVLSANTTCCDYKETDTSLGQEHSDNHIINDQCSFQSVCSPADDIVAKNISQGRISYIAVDFFCQGN